ncbi:MAG: hypothetical protein JWQ43_1847, partial [Glaciihabitans sp.]|nr:hypothetical protein [Glaciihabitans sp.]
MTDTGIRPASDIRPDTTFAPAPTSPTIKAT